MRDIHRITEEYRQSDLRKRVFLFLEFRELRDQFSEIDREEGFIERKGETDTVTPYPSEVNIIEETLMNRLKGWKQRFKGAFQGAYQRGQ